MSEKIGEDMQTTLRAALAAGQTLRAGLVETRKLLREAIHELRFLVESHPRSCGCQTCSFLSRHKDLW